MRSWCGEGLFTALLMWVGLHAAQAAGAASPWPEPYAQVKATAWSNGMPVADLQGDWRRGYDPNVGPQRAYLSAQAEAGLGMPTAAPTWAQGWRVGALARVEAFAALSGEAADLLAAYQGQTDPARVGTYNADHRTLMWRGTGLAVHTPAWRVGRFQMGASWQYLSLTRLRTTQTQGVAAYLGNSTYEYDLTLAEDNERVHSSFLANPADRGDAASLSVHLAWQPDDRWSLKLSADDLWSRLHWPQLQANRASITSQVASRDAEGYLNYRAAIVGKYTVQALDARMPTTVSADVAWRHEAGDMTLQAVRRWGLQQLWVGWRQAGELAWSVEAEPMAGALRLGLAWGGLHMLLGADKLDDTAHVQQLNLSYRTPF